MVDWDQILTRDGPIAWQTAWRVLRDRSDADECFQEACLEALEFSRTHTVKHWRTLLQRLAAARAIDRLRQRVRRRDHESRLPVDRPPLLTPTPLAQAENAELAAKLRAALTQVPPDQAQAFWLFHREGWSYLQIAEAMNVSTDLVGVWIGRARRRLAELLSTLKQSLDEVSS
jgi:RNA polymerase sigma-70 factor (ECF subfamily)